MTTAEAVAYLRAERDRMIGWRDHWQHVDPDNREPRIWYEGAAYALDEAAFHVTRCPTLDSHELPPLDSDGGALPGWREPLDPGDGPNDGSDAESTRLAELLEPPRY